MPLRKNHGKPRVVAPQIKELRPIDKRDPDKRSLEAKARWGLEKALKEFSKKGPPQTVLERTFDIFLTLRGEISEDSAHVQDNIARRSRWTALSEYYLTKALEADPASEQGMTWVKMAQLTDTTAKQLDVMVMAWCDKLNAGRKAPTNTVEALRAAVAKQFEDGGS